jgi:hypothetical protein
LLGTDSTGDFSIDNNVYNCNQCGMDVMAGVLASYRTGVKSEPAERDRNNALPGMDLWSQ